MNSLHDNLRSMVQRYKQLQHMGMGHVELECRFGTMQNNGCFVSAITASQMRQLLQTLELSPCLTGRKVFCFWYPCSKNWSCVRPTGIDARCQNLALSAFSLTYALKSLAVTTISLIAFVLTRAQQKKLGNAAHTRLSLSKRGK